MTYQLYIGSNNKTKRLESSKIERIVSESHQGFTILPCTGYWQGERERSCAVLISDLSDRVMATIERLKDELDQDAIAYQIVPELEFI